MSSSQSPAESTGSSNEQQKKQSQSRRGLHSGKPHHGRSPHTPVTGKEESTTQKRVRSIQQRSSERGADCKSRPQTSRLEHNKGTDSKPSQRSSGPNKSKTTHSRKSDSDTKKLPKINDQSTKTTSSKDIKRTDRKDSGIGYSPPTTEASANEVVGEENPVVEGKSEPTEKLTQSDSEGKSVAVTEAAETKKDNRIQYTRDTLLALSKLPVCQVRHPALNEFTCDLLDAESKRKHPTALSLIKEQLPKISLSPQRKSFQGGCGWKDTKNQDSPKSTNQDGNFDFESPYPPSRASQPKPKVIDHIPLRDQELGRDKKKWRDRNKEPEWATEKNYTSNWDDEPEWMEFGPNDRFEVIELKGLEEHEREREARLGRDEAESKPVSDEESPLTNSEHIKEQSGLEGKAPNDEEHTPQPPSKEELMLRTALELDNEFMLDGFDFSTGLSFCQALDDEDDGRAARNSTEVTSNALMKVLKGGGKSGKPSNKKSQKSILGVSSRPVNALTLDEIQARENIPATPTEVTPHKTTHGGDLGAFNKLVAGLQSTGALNKDKNQTEPTETKATPTSSSHVQVPTVAKPVISDPKHPQQQFGNIIEKEIEFEEEVVTGAHPHFPTPAPPQFPNRNTSAFSRVEHLERMLEKLDHNHQSMLRQKTAPDVPPQGFPEPPHMKKLIPGHSVRMSTMERPMPHMIEREYAYSDMPSDYRMEMMPPPNIGIRPQSGVNRSSSNNWAVEMERRRLYELKQMERARMVERERMYNGGMQHKPLKPNISLLPTAVMRQMHNSKPNQSLSDKSSSGGPRMDQDMGGKMPPPGMMSDGEPHRMHPGMYPMGGASRPPLRPVSDPSAMMYQRGYYNVIPPPHGGMQNPYMY